MKLPKKVEKLLTNTEDIEYLIDIVKGNVETPEELDTYANEIDYLYKFDENEIYNIWLDL